MIEPRDVPVFVLCGGMGTRLNGSGARLPKPMVEIGDRPMLLHIVETYARFGFRRFVLCAGWRSDAVAHYFALLPAVMGDFTVSTREGRIFAHQDGAVPDLEITVAHTGPTTGTGARIARAAARHLGDAEHFAVTYGDGLCDADLAAELAFHLDHGATGTVLAIRPPARFGRLAVEGDRVVAFCEKEGEEGWINGGFFLFRRRFLAYLDPHESCVLEREPLARLAAEGELRVWYHEGFWSCVDTPRERELLQGLCDSGTPPWRGKP